MKRVLGLAFVCGVVGPLVGAAPFLLIGLMLPLVLPFIAAYAYGWGLPIALVFAAICALDLVRGRPIAIGTQALATGVGTVGLVLLLPLSIAGFDLASALARLGNGFRSGEAYGFILLCAILVSLAGAASIQVAQAADIIPRRRSS